ncbi:hypothetical protein BM449_05455 [Synechococcus sp. SynAce01]|nr:hypothetical protein BM449_05455 [Synechococcus sp. SynAce01]
MLAAGQFTAAKIKHGKIMLSCSMMFVILSLMLLRTMIHWIYLLVGHHVSHFLLEAFMLE